MGENNTELVPILKDFSEAPLSLATKEHESPFFFSSSVSIQVFRDVLLTNKIAFIGRIFSCNTSIYKEINSVENFFHSEIRKDPIYKNAEFKQIMNKDYPETKKIYVDQDSYLRQKVGEILNASRK